MDLGDERESIMSYEKPRINIQMSTVEMIMAMADGNPGALNVMMEILDKATEIDCDDWLRPISPILSLDTHDIYGPRIWMLYKDVCNFNISHTIALLRAVQLGHMMEKDLNHAIDNNGEGIDIKQILAKVKESLPAFVMDTYV